MEEFVNGHGPHPGKCDCHDEDNKIEKLYVVIKENTAVGDALACYNAPTGIMPMVFSMRDDQLPDLIERAQTLSQETGEVLKIISLDNRVDIQEVYPFESTSFN